MYYRINMVQRKEFNKLNMKQNINDRLTDPNSSLDDFESLPRITTMTNQYEEDNQEDTIYYDHHCDLSKVHVKVRNKFSELHSKVPEWKMELSRLEQQLESGSTKIIENTLKKRIAVIKDLIHMTSEENGFLLWREYLNRSKDILLEYTKLTPEDDTHDLVYRYNGVIRDYCSILIVRKINHDYTLCPNCNKPRVNSNGSIICVDCGIKDELISKESYQSTGRKHTFVQKNQYLTKENFMKGLQRFQGKRSRKLPVDMFERMDEYARKFDMPTSEEVKKMPLNNDGKRGPKVYNRLYMKSLLDILGYESYYNDVNLITHLYWGWTLPDVSEYEEQIKKDYELSQTAFNEMKKDRQSSLILPYRLYRHLRKVGYPCKIEDFDIVSTPEIRQSYEEIWKEICNKLGWEFEPI